MNKSLTAAELQKVQDDSLIYGGWSEYLAARAASIRAFRNNDGKSFDEIVQTLNLTDAEHAERIYVSTSSGITYKPVPVDSKTTIELPTVPTSEGFENGICEDVDDRLRRLMERALTEGRHSERESFVAENMLSENFEMLDWDADVFACTLGQMLAMLKRYGVRLDEPNTKISSQGVAVDQNYFWDEDMSRCQRGVKYQLLGKGGMPEYKVYDGDPFWVAYALLPKRREPKKT